MSPSPNVPEKNGVLSRHSQTRRAEGGAANGLAGLVDHGAGDAAAVIERFAKVHVLVNNAGVVIGGEPGEFDLDDWRWIVDVNLMGVVYGVETFVLDLRQEVAAAPQVHGYAIRLLDATTLEVDIDREQSVNRLFIELQARGVEVLSLRNKANRLEELFLRLTADAPDDAATPP